jgi:hypothetical protein
MVNLSWVPGHKGIKGNEQADKLAKVAGDLPATPIFNHTITWSKSHATKLATYRWKKLWASTWKLEHVTLTLPKLPALKLRFIHRGVDIDHKTHARLIQPPIPAKILKNSQE